MVFSKDEESLAPRSWSVNFVGCISSLCSIRSVFIINYLATFFQTALLASCCTILHYAIWIYQFFNTKDWIPLLFYFLLIHFRCSHWRIQVNSCLPRDLIERLKTAIVMKAAYCVRAVQYMIHASSELILLGASDWLLLLEMCILECGTIYHYIVR